MVNSATNSKHKNSSVYQFDVDADRLNEYYSQISTDPDYDKDSVMFQLNDILCNQNNDFIDWSASSVCALLSKIKHISPGSDDIPAWFYKLFANRLGCQQNFQYFSC